MGESPCRIRATEAAAGALDRLRAEHGEIVLHLAGGAEDAGTPMAMVADEMRLGARDLHLGTVHGVEVYEQQSRPGAHFRAGWDVELDVVPGRAPGFSLHPGEGMRFALRDTLPTAR